MPLRRGRHLALLLLAALVMVGCGGDEGGGGGGEPAPAPESGGGEPVATLDVVETDFEIDPEEAQVDESGVVEIDISNEGQSPHALDIEGPDQEFVSDTIDPGQSTTLTADLPPGTHTWYCPVGNHRSLGMEGSITVGQGGGGGGGGGSGASGEDGDDSGDDAGDDSGDEQPGSSGGFGY